MTRDQPGTPTTRPRKPERPPVEDLALEGRAQTQAARELLLKATLTAEASAHDGVSLPRRPAPRPNLPLLTVARTRAPRESLKLSLPNTRYICTSVKVSILAVVILAARCSLKSLLFGSVRILMHSHGCTGFA